MFQYLYRLSFEPFDRGLALAEAAELLRCDVATDFVCSDDLYDIAASAYLRQRLELRAESPTFDGLCDAVRNARLPFERFRIDSAHTLDAILEPTVDKLGTRGVATALADAMSGSPDLDAPAVHLLALRLPDRWVFGQVMQACAQDWKRHAGKPHSYSSAVNARHARALVNIAAPPHLNCQTFCDPMCGAGTVLIEAAARGLAVFGCDINPALASDAQENLRHFSYPGEVLAADACTLATLRPPSLLTAPSGAPPTTRFDASVIDFPYGHFSPVAADLYGRVLAAVRPCVKRLVCITPQPAADLLTRHGFTVLRQCTASKSRLVRHFTLASAI